MDALDYVIVLTYLLGVIFVAWKVSRKENAEEFLSGNKQFGAGSINASISASLTGGSALAAYVALLYLIGFSAFWVFIGASIGLLFFIPFAKKVKREGDIQGHYTLLDFIGPKIGKHNTLISALILFVTFLLLIVAETIISGKAISLFLGFPYWLGVVFAGSIVFFYILLGGVKSDIKTDLFQYFLFLLFLVLGVFLYFSNPEITYNFNIFASGMMYIVLSIFIGIFALFISADVWQKIFAAKSEKEVSKGIFYSAFSFLAVTFVITLIGLIIKHNFPNISPNEALIFGFSQLPAGLLGIGLVVLLSATMSTTDTALIVSSLFISRDILSRFYLIGRDKLLYLTKLFIILIFIIIVSVSIFTDDLVFVFYNSFSFALILSPIVISSFFFNLNKKVIGISLILGIIGAFYLVFSGKLTAEYVLIPFLVTLVSLVVLETGLRVIRKVI